MLSCRPRAITLNRFGMVLVSGGRPPLSVWATRDGDQWTAFDIPSEHSFLTRNRESCNLRVPAKSKVCVFLSLQVSTIGSYRRR